MILTEVYVVKRLTFYGPHGDMFLALDANREVFWSAHSRLAYRLSTRDAALRIAGGFIDARVVLLVPRRGRS